MAEDTGTPAGGEPPLFSLLPELVRTGEHAWRTDTHMFSQALLTREGVYRVDGGETIAHGIRAIEDAFPGRRVIALDVTFVREGKHDQPTLYDLEVLHSGRTLGFVLLRATQPERGTVALLRATVAPPTEGLAHQGIPAPTVDWAGAVADLVHLLPEPVEVAGGENLSGAGTGEPLLHVRTPLPSELRDATEVRMYLGYVADHMIISPAFRPHRGVGFRTKHAFYTAPLGLQLRYWGEPQPGDVLVHEMTSPVMAGGMATTQSYGFDQAGALVFSASMDVLVRSQ